MRVLALLSVFLALPVLGCATNGGYGLFQDFTGSNTVRCTKGGDWSVSIDQVTQEHTEHLACAGELIRTGTLSDNGAKVALEVIQGAANAAASAIQAGKVAAVVAP